MSTYKFRLCVVDDIGIEIWKEISGSNHYEISTEGRYKQFDEIKTPWVSDNDYDMATIRINGKPKHFRIHKLVGEAFLPKWCSSNNQINHKDENKHNNKVGNLEWCSGKYNKDYSRDRIAHTNKPLKVSQYTLEGKYIDTYDSIDVACGKVGCSHTQMKNHLEGKRSCLSVKGFIWKYAD
ncbi:MAG: HNH endonuclease [Methanobrevibacter sp.]|nr:HNH endonuclease [Bacteroidales bacterium]MBO7732279.1 HNH endonuclease [Methanobrevibacter sp.]